jgi:hypothetical protein
MRELVRAASVLFIALQLATPAGQTALAPFVDPIQGVAHGAGFGLDGNEIVVTAEFIAQTQNVYTQHVLDSANTAQRALYESKRSALDALAIGGTLRRDQQVALYANSLLLDWLIEQVMPSDAARLKVRNHVLISWMERGLGYLGEGQDFALLPSETALFVQVGILAPAAAAAGGVAAPQGAPPADSVLQARETYAKECRKAGVPIPPTWGDAGWMSQGILADPFISVGLNAEVYMFKSVTPKGVCLALPRYGKAPNEPNNSLLGIICMSDGKAPDQIADACFWDNQKDDKTTDIPRTGNFPLNTFFAAGDELDGGQGGTCTACHAGENAYIVHPSDPAFDGILGDIEISTWYKPMVAITWPQNPGPDAGFPKPPAGEKSCRSCHQLPKIEKGLATPAGENYCDAVLKIALDKTMPMAGVRQPLGGPFSTPGYRYKTHNMYLATACADAKKP